MTESDYNSTTILELEQQILEIKQELYDSPQPLLTRRTDLKVQMTIINDLIHERYN